MPVAKPAAKGKSAFLEKSELIKYVDLYCMYGIVVSFLYIKKRVCDYGILAKMKK